MHRGFLKNLDSVYFVCLVCDNMTCFCFALELDSMQNVQVSPEVPQHEAADKIPSQVPSGVYDGTCEVFDKADLDASCHVRHAVGAQLNRRWQIPRSFGVGYN